MLRKLSTFWLQNVNPYFTSLVATIGTVGLGSCLLVLLLLSWLFEEVLGKKAFAFDTSFLLTLRQFANPTWDGVMLAITRLGNPSIVILVTAVTLGSLWWKHRRQEANIFAIACLGAVILNTGLKLVFRKPRPQLWSHSISETSFSFPSGHALGSFVLYGFIAYLLAERYPKFARPIYSLSVILIALIGFSRLYLGVHWPTDIIAGYGLGFLWLMICLTLLKLQTLHRV